MQSQTPFRFKTSAQPEHKPAYDFGAGAFKLFKGPTQPQPSWFNVTQPSPAPSKDQQVIQETSIQPTVTQPTWFKPLTSQSNPVQAVQEPTQAVQEPTQATQEPVASWKYTPVTQPTWFKPLTSQSISTQAVQKPADPWTTQPIYVSPTQPLARSSPLAQSSQPLAQSSPQPLRSELEHWSLCDLSKTKQAFIKPRLQELFDLRNNLDQKLHQFRIARACIHKQDVADDLTQDLENMAYTFQLLLFKDPCKIIATRVKDTDKRNLYTVYIKMLKVLLMDKCKTKINLIKYLDRQISLTGNKRFMITFRLLDEHNIVKLTQDFYDEITGFLVAIILFINFEGYPELTLKAGRACCYYPNKVSRTLTDLVAACYGPATPATRPYNDPEIGAWIKGM